MSELMVFSKRQSGQAQMRIGLLRLADGAPVIAAYEFGFFADEGLEVELFVEPSWANIADKLAYGFLDAAVIVPPLAFLVHLGLRGTAEPLLIPYAISANGNTVTLSRALADAVQEVTARRKLPRAEALAACLRQKRTTLGVVHSYSTHSLLLRYWLAAAGIEAGRDFNLAVVPPERVVEAMTSGQIAGFCAGVPWGEVARRAEAGRTIAASRDIWRHAPEKALAVCARFAEGRQEILAGALRALLRAAKFCDDPKNASYTAALLSRRKYVNVDSHAILAGLPGSTAPETGCVFYRGAATFPWRSHALWFLSEMRRWGVIEASIGLCDLAWQVYRPDLYRAALGPTGEPVPVSGCKLEGAHDTAFFVDAVPAPVAMPADRFCDGIVFDPEALLLPAKPGLTATSKL
jgi:two-component system, oxyanion-binding sensor